MAAITDLTWQQLLDKLPAGSITVLAAAGSNPAKVQIDVSLAADIAADALTDSGVIKFFSALLNAGASAQATANTGQATGERLAAFTVATSGPTAQGFVPISRTFTARSELATAANIVGPVN